MDYSTDGVGFGSGLDWDMTSNQGLTPLVNYNFNLQVEGIYNLPCKSVRVFQRENEYDILQEGGLNDYVHMLRKPISKPMTFQVERYVGIDMLDPLALGTDLALPVILMVSRYQGEGENGVLDLSDSMQRMYTFTGCTVMAKEYGELNAERSGLLVETTTIAYREMICIDNPSTLSKRKTWSLKKDHEHMQRDAERKQAKALMGVTERTKSEMEERAKMYVDKKVKEIPMHVLDYKGKKVSTTRNSQTHEQEIGIAPKKPMASKEEREKAATRYYLPGSVSRSSYAGSFKNSAVTNKDEVHKEDMEKQAKRHFLPGSKTVAQYMGTVENSATVTKDEVRKENMPNRKGGAIIPEMKPTEVRKGGATIKKMEPTKGQRRYFIAGSKSMSSYSGTVQASATVNEDEVRKDKMPNRKGGATTKKMEPTKGQRRYFIAGSKSMSSYSGTVQASATVNEDEVRKGKMPNRKGGANIPQMRPAEARKGGANIPQMRPAEARKGGANIPVMKPAQVRKGGANIPQMKSAKIRKGGANIPVMKPAQVRKGGANIPVMKSAKIRKGGANIPVMKSAKIRKGGADIPEMKPTQSREGGATIKKMEKTKDQRRYFIDGSASMSSYSGTVRTSAEVNKNEVRKSEMQLNTRLWPQTRSAADVAAFLKKR